MLDPLEPCAPTTTPIHRRIVTWDENGHPVVTSEAFLSKQQISDIINVAIAQPYPDPQNLEPEFAGMTNLEVMVIKQVRRAALTGEAAQVETILDRILGRPKQSSEVTKLTLTYEDTLKEIARKETERASSAILVSPPSINPLASYADDIFG